MWPLPFFHDFRHAGKNPLFREVPVFNLFLFYLPAMINYKHVFLVPVFLSCSIYGQLLAAQACKGNEIPSIPGKFNPGIPFLQAQRYGCQSCQRETSTGGYA